MESPNDRGKEGSIGPAEIGRVPRETEEIDVDSPIDVDAPTEDKANAKKELMDALRGAIAILQEADQLDVVDR